jgi:hypothetical protein
MDLSRDAIFSLSFVRERVRELSQKIAAPEGRVLIGESHGDGTPNIEIIGGYEFIIGVNGTPILRDSKKYFAFVVNERGIEFERRVTDDLNELLYWIFDAITSSMATDFELHNRIEAQDFRRLWFAKQEELLGVLNPEWRDRKRDHHSEILREHPFIDQLS